MLNIKCDNEITGYLSTSEKNCVKKLIEKSVQSTQ